MKEKRILFDLDGTILNSFNRLYNLFKDLIPESTFSKEEYWNLKRNKIDHKAIIEKYYPTVSYELFNNKWLKLIEDPKYLSMDLLYDDTIQTLSCLRNNGFLIDLLTARQNKNNCIKELEEKGIINLFSNIYVYKNKSDFFLNKQEKNYLYSVGDTGKDILLAKENKICSIAITHGFLCEKKLKEYNPDYIINSLDDIKTVIDNHKR